MDIIVNGEPRSVADETTVAALIESLGFAPKALIVELDGNILGKDQYATTPLRSGNKIELIQFVGGG